MCFYENVGEFFFEALNIHSLTNCTTGIPEGALRALGEPVIRFHHFSNKHRVMVDKVKSKLWEHNI